MSIRRRLSARLRRDVAGAARDALQRRREEGQRRQERAAAWRAAGDFSPARIAAEYEARRDALDRELRAWCRPVAAWTLRDGDPTVKGSHMGGRPALRPDEPWPGEDDPMRFWAQVNLADLAPYAKAYGIAMPSGGLVQLFAGEEGGEEARYIPPAGLQALELREEIPINSYLDSGTEPEEMYRRSQIIELHPEALVPWQEASGFSNPARPIDDAATTSEDLPGYSFGWWPFSTSGLDQARERWPDTPPREGWVFLAVCDSNFDLGLSFSDAGFLGATLPAGELAAGDFGHLLCDGESS